MSDSPSVGRSTLSWVFQSLGFPYAALLFVAGLACFLLALLVVLRGKGPMAAAALILIVPIPLLIGVFAALQHGVSFYSLLATSSTAPKPSSVAVGISGTLVAVSAGLLAMLPGLSTAVIGAFLRSFGGKSEPPDNA